MERSNENIFLTNETTNPAIYEKLVQQVDLPPTSRGFIELLARNIKLPDTHQEKDIAAYVLKCRQANPMVRPFSQTTIIPSGYKENRYYPEIEYDHYQRLDSEVRLTHNRGPIYWENKVANTTDRMSINQQINRGGIAHRIIGRFGNQNAYQKLISDELLGQWLELGYQLSSGVLVLEEDTRSDHAYRSEYLYTQLVFGDQRVEIPFGHPTYISGMGLYIDKRSQYDKKDELIEWFKSLTKNNH